MPARRAKAHAETATAAAAIFQKNVGWEAATRPRRSTSADRIEFTSGEYSGSWAVSSKRRTLDCARHHAHPGRKINGNGGRVPFCNPIQATRGRFRCRSFQDGPLDRGRCTVICDKLIARLGGLPEHYPIYFTSKFGTAVPGRLRKFFGRNPVDKAAAIQEVADFCAALTEAFSNRMPDRFGMSLPIQAAWWAVALYVQLPMRLKMRRFDEEVWRAASGAIAGHMMDRLFPDFPEEGPEKGDLAEALQDQVLAVSKLWIAAFGLMPRPARFQEPKRLAEELRALLADEGLDLQARFNLDSEDDEERREAALSEFCEVFALFFDTASRSKP